MRLRILVKKEEKKKAIGREKKGDSRSFSLLPLPQVLQKQYYGSHRDAAVGQIEDGKGPDLDEIGDETVPQAIDDIRDPTADDETETDLHRRRLRRFYSQPSYQDECHGNEQRLDGSEMPSESNPLVDRALETGKSPQHDYALRKEYINEDGGKDAEKAASDTACEQQPHEPMIANYSP